MISAQLRTSILLHLALVAIIAMPGSFSFFRTRPVVSVGGPLQLIDVEIKAQGGGAAPAPKQKAVTKQKAIPEPLETPESVPPVSEGEVGRAVIDAGEAVMGGGGRDHGIMSVRDRYLSEILQTIESRKFYPTEARLRRQTGVVEVTFSVLADGSISNVEITKPSAYGLLNRAGISILQKIGRFNSIPLELGERKVRLTVPIEYDLR